MLLSLIACSLQNDFSMKSALATRYYVGFHRAIHNLQSLLTFTTFHLDKAPSGTKDNIISEVSWDEGEFAALNNGKGEVPKMLSNSRGRSCPLHKQIWPF